MGVLDVIVVGAGALGNAVVQNLGLHRLRSVLIVDPDRIEAANLSLAPMFTAAMVGEPKALTLATAASASFPETNWKVFGAEIADLGWGRIAGHDLILGCVDRDSARLEMARIGTRLGIPVCDGGLGVAGRVSYFPSRPEAACFSCRLTAVRRRELLSTWRSQTFPCLRPGQETARVTTIEQAAATGMLQVEVGLRGGAAMTTELRPKGIIGFQMHASADCPFHEPPEPLVALPVALKPGLSYGWEWSICAHAECRNCGRDWWPWVRRARLKACPQCGSEEIVALECVDRIDASSPWADQPPARIGLPEDHRYTVREMRTKQT